MSDDMDGKVCLITGAASGLGRIAARELAKLGSQVILVDIEIEEGRQARDEIVSLTGNNDVEFQGCDISSFAQVRRLADDVMAKYPRLDVLINNAGLTQPLYTLSDDGFETHMATCHLGHFLLTQLLLDRLKSSALARIIQISSDAHKAGPGLDWNDMNCEKVWKGRKASKRGAFVAYQRAKLAMVLYTYELAKRTEGTGVTVNVVSPGYFVRTNVYRHMPRFFKMWIWLIRPLLADPEKSAQTYVYLATSPEVEGVSGKYWEYCALKESSDHSHDDAEMQRLWAWSENATGLA
ncbi:MAG: SDR family oxidoreductase [Rhodospirillaceae bacterium]